MSEKWIEPEPSETLNFYAIPVAWEMITPTGERIPLEATDQDSAIAEVRRRQAVWLDNG